MGMQEQDSGIKMTFKPGQLYLCGKGGGAGDLLLLIESIELRYGPHQGSFKVRPGWRVLSSIVGLTRLSEKALQNPGFGLELISEMRE